MDVDFFPLAASELHKVAARGHYRIQLSGFSLDFFFKPSSTKRCIVLSPGFLNTDAHPYPYFQRLTWLDEFDACGICLADPTLALSRDIGIGWFIGDKKEHFLLEVADCISRLLAHLHIPNCSTLFFGSSAGGFSSMGFAAAIPGSHAFAVNPQTDIARFHSISELSRTLSVCFGTANNIETIQALYGSRLNLVNFFEEVGHVPSFMIWQNVNDLYHYHNHLLPFLSRLSNLKLNSMNKILLSADSELGHNPPPLSKLRQCFDDLLSEM